MLNDDFILVSKKKCAKGSFSRKLKLKNNCIKTTEVPISIINENIHQYRFHIYK